VAQRRVNVEVPDEELAGRSPAAAMTDALARPRRGWERLYIDTVQGADTGADLDFLLGSSGDAVARDSH
jgi:dihydroxy-acid dehydratase